MTIVSENPDNNREEVKLPSLISETHFTEHSQTNIL